MKNLPVIIALFMLSTTIAVSQNTSGASAQHSCKVVITPQTTIHRLDSLMIKLKKQNFVLAFTKLEYNAEGELVKIKGSISYKTQGGLPNATFQSDKLESSEITVTDKPSVQISGK